MSNLKKLDDKRVKAFIKWSQEKAKEIYAEKGKTPSSVVDINYVGWRLLKETVRGDSKHRYDHDYDAAAAEHYMYIRFLAGKTGDPTCYAAPSLYSAKKLLDQILGRLQSGQAQDGHPVLPANPYIVAWGHEGVEDGLKDYKKVTKGAKYNIGSGVGVLAGFSLPKNTADKIGNYAVKAGNKVPDYAE